MSKNIKPFLKWAGGKTQLLPVIMRNLPEDIEEIDTYIEPFIGAGAVFFSLIKENKFKKYIINDINTKLVNLYIIIRDEIEQLLNTLETIRNEYIVLATMEDKEKYFYEIRKEFNSENKEKVREAAMFIFLNKTCFNGLYRENSKGEFNVPFGKHKNPSIFDSMQLREISTLLNVKDDNGELEVTILNNSFEEMEKYISENVFVYLDPPYRPITEGGFNAYSKSGFNDDAQVKLARFYSDMSKKGAKLMLSNSDPKNLDQEDEFFDDLYKDFKIQRVTASRMINSDAKGRGGVTELLIENYLLP